MVTDTLIRIKNGYLAGKKTVETPCSKMEERLVKILLKEGYLSHLEIKTVKAGTKKKGAKVKIMAMDLKYDGRKPVLRELKIVSKPSLRIYVQKDNIPSVLGGQGLVILSTPRGLMTGREAQKKGLGGEIICKIW